MKSRTTRRFRSCFEGLPPDVKRRAAEAYRIWRDDPSHPSLRFKRLATRSDVVSVRIGLNWRALGVVEGDAVVRFWIGSHTGYDALVRNPRQGTAPRGGRK